MVLLFSKFMAPTISIMKFILMTTLSALFSVYSHASILHVQLTLDNTEHKRIRLYAPLDEYSNALILTNDVNCHDSVSFHVNNENIIGILIIIDKAPIRLYLDSNTDLRVVFKSDTAWQIYGNNAIILKHYNELYQARGEIFLFEYVNYKFSATLDYYNCSVVNDIIEEKIYLSSQFLETNSNLKELLIKDILINKIHGFYFHCKSKMEFVGLFEYLDKLLDLNTNVESSLCNYSYYYMFAHQYSADKCDLNGDILKYYCRFLKLPDRVRSFMLQSTIIAYWQHSSFHSTSGNLYCCKRVSAIPY